jgi:hypothetical protein
MGNFGCQVKTLKQRVQNAKFTEKEKGLKINAILIV